VARADPATPALAGSPFVLPRQIDATTVEAVTAFDAVPLHGLGHRGTSIVSCR
jgi:hypothetical protein